MEKMLKIKNSIALSRKRKR